MAQHDRGITVCAEFIKARVLMEESEKMMFCAQEEATTMAFAYIIL